MVNNPDYGRLFLWGYTDLRDIAQAFQLALQKEGTTHEVYNIGATEIVAEDPSLVLINRYFPQGPVTNERAFVENPYHGLIDISKANRELGLDQI